MKSPLILAVILSTLSLEGISKNSNMLYYPLSDILKATLSIYEQKPYTIRTFVHPGGPAPLTLNDSFTVRDSLFYDAVFNSCNLALVEKTLDKNFVFRQDQGYTSQTKTQSRADYMNGVNRMCDPKSKGQAPAMRRELVKGSAQVFVADKDNVVQTGTQHFFAKETGKPEQLVEESKFTREWKRGKDGRWRIMSELDFLYNPHPENAVAAAPAPAIAFPDELTGQVYRMDSVLFGAFNRQDLDMMKTLFTPDLEFFHDHDGLGLYAKIIDNFRGLFERNKNSSITRELVPGSLQVGAIRDFGAIQLGEHRFCHLENGQPVCGNFKFIHIWKKEGDQWKICRVVSYGHVAASDTLAGSLYQTVAGLDKTLFDAFNHRQLDVMKGIFSQNLEFYQDNEGMENYDQTISDFKNMFSDNSNSGLRRELVPGTLEVYPLPGYGAIEVGEHRFVHQENGTDVAGTFKFVHIWQQTSGQWKLTRVISFGH
jgi:ketosteroid isomerase-like protein